MPFLALCAACCLRRCWPRLLRRAGGRPARRLGAAAAAAAGGWLRRRGFGVRLGFGGGSASQRLGLGGLRLRRLRLRRASLRRAASAGCRLGGSAWRPSGFSACGFSVRFGVGFSRSALAASVGLLGFGGGRFLGGLFGGLSCGGVFYRGCSVFVIACQISLTPRP